MKIWYHIYDKIISFFQEIKNKFGCHSPEKMAMQIYSAERNGEL